MSVQNEEFDYSAFISYRHLPEDRKWAKWLLSALETYRTPKALQKQGVPTRLGKAFRDQDEILASADLSSEIRTALEKSRFLIVVCSKETPASKWVGEEIRTFHALGRSDQIIGLLIDGEPGEAFPELMLKVPKSISDDGIITWSEEEREPIAADVRPRDDTSHRELKRSALLRVAATILGVKFDDLKRRDEARQKRKLQFTVAASLAAVVFTSGLSWFAFDQRSEAIANAERAQKQEQIALINEREAKKQEKEANAQRKLAVANAERATRALDAATDTANGLVFNLAQEFRNSGLPNATILRILDEAQKLQDKLASGSKQTNELLRSRAAILIERSDSQIGFGDPSGALKSVTEALVISRKLAAAEPADTGFQHDVSVSLDRIADIKRRQDPVAALTLYEEGLVIRRKLAAAEFANTQFQRDVSVSLIKIADIKKRQDPIAALSLYEQSLEIVRKLAAGEPVNTQFQRHVSISLEKIADIKIRQDPAAALTLYEESLVIARMLAAGEPANTQFQRDVSVNLEKIADIKMRQDPATALPLFEESLVIARKLAAGEPANTGFQRDVSVSLGRIADIKKRQNPTAALTLFEEALVIARKLAVGEPTNSRLQRDVSVSLGRIADIKKRQDPTAALALYEEGLVIRRKLAAAEPTIFQFQTDIVVSLYKLSFIQKGQARKASLREGIAILKMLVAAGKLSSDKKSWPGIFQRLLEEE